MPSRSAEAIRNQRAGQRRIRRVCVCGRTVIGNVGWWSHTHTPNGEERDDHGYNGRA